MEPEIIEAQKRLEQKRSEVSTKQTVPMRIGSGQEPGTVERVCRDCGSVFRCPEAINYTRCPDCRQKMNEERAEALQRERGAIEAEMRTAEQKRLFSEVQVGKRYQGQTWDDYLPSTEAARKVSDVCRNYAENFRDAMETGRCLVMIGGPGTGKNMLSALICQDVAGQGFTALHTTAMKLVRRVKESWGKGSEETESQAIRNFTLPDLLVVDEIGVQFGSQAEQIILTEIINDRYEAMRPTIIISNLTVPQLEEILGKRVVDRFYESGGRVLVFNWQSYRRQKIA